MFISETKVLSSPIGSNLRSTPENFMQGDAIFKVVDLISDPGHPC